MAVHLNQNFRLNNPDFRSRQKDTSYLYIDNPFHTKTQTDIISRPEELEETRKVKPKDLKKGSNFLIDITPKKGKKKTKTGKPIIDSEPPPPPPIVEEPTKLDGKLFEEEHIKMLEDILSKYGKDLYEKLKDTLSGKGTKAAERAKEAIDVMNAETAAKAEEDTYKLAFEREMTARQMSEAEARARSQIEPRILFDKKLGEFEKFKAELAGRDKVKLATDPINFKDHKNEADQIRLAKQMLNSIKMDMGSMDNKSRSMARLQTEKQKYRTNLNTVPIDSVGKAVVMPYGAQSFSMIQGAA